MFGWEFVSTVPRSALRQLARLEVDIEKLTNTPRWRAGRIVLARFRNLRIPFQARPQHRIPNNGYRSSKISHWLKDHLRRIEDMAIDAVCAAATGFSDYQSPEPAAAAFNDHIGPIGDLYGFKLRMVIEGNSPVLRGDVIKALSVLTYLCSTQRTPEIDWLLDVVTVWLQDRPLEWRGTWQRKLRHTRRGKLWQARRKLREQKEAIEAPRERRQQLERATLADLVDGETNRVFLGSHTAVTPTMAEQEGAVAGDRKRLLGHEQYYPWQWGRKRKREQVRLPSDPYLKSLPDPNSDHWRRGRDLQKKR